MHKDIKGLDGIRALAVLAVIATHLPILVALQNKGLLPLTVTPMVNGSTGVLAFFVLSGFLITTLLIREMESTGTVSIRAFVVRRSLRIFPLYLLFLLATTLLHVFGRNVTSWESLLYAYLYAYNFVPRDIYTHFMGHTWSLAVEEHFYLLWPSVFMLFFRGHRSALVIMLALYVATAPALLQALSSWNATHFVNRWSVVAGYSIAIGCLLALLMPWIKDIVRSRWVAGLGIALFANSLVLSGDPFGMDVGPGSSYLRAVGIALLIGWITGNQGSLAVRVLEVAPLRYIGAISYGLYMYQGLFLSSTPWRPAGSTWPPPQNIGFLMLLIAAPVSYHFFEQPFLRLKDKLSRRVRTPDAQPSAA
jgi:peptidoglycan/LPS O-acetylase OafA/YrhL